jgi:hypothetical protein
MLPDLVFNEQKSNCYARHLQVAHNATIWGRFPIFRLVVRLDRYKITDFSNRSLSSIPRLTEDL